MIRVLCLDIEGGFGGSSRSLLKSIEHQKRDQVLTEVWSRRSGPIAAQYAERGITQRTEPLMPKVSALPKLSRNAIAFTRMGYDFWAARSFRRRLASEVNHRFDVVHFNHEALFILAKWLRSRTRAAFSMHLRTNLLPSAFARWQCSVIAQVIDYRIFITENEARTYGSLGGTGTGKVIFNIVEPVVQAVPHPSIPQDHRFRIACLSNYAWVRGIDRLVEIAEELARRGKRDVLFAMAGDMRLPWSLPGELGRIARRGGTLADYAAARGVADMFVFLGHVPDPERVLAACDMLAKPTREDNPWGRDILEAMAQGKPVLSVGRYDTFVETGVTGILQPVFDAADAAGQIQALAQDRASLSRLGHAARERVFRLCSGPERAADLLSAWHEAIDRRRSPAV